MYNWYSKKDGAQQVVTKNIIEGIKRSAKGSVERRKIEALLHASYTMDDIRPLLGKTQELIDGMNDNEKGNEVEGMENGEQLGTRNALETGGREDVEMDVAEDRPESIQEDILDFDEVSRRQDSHIRTVGDCEGDIIGDILGSDCNASDAEVNGDDIYINGVHNGNESVQDEEKPVRRRGNVNGSCDVYDEIGAERLNEGTGDRDDSVVTRSQNSSGSSANENCNTEEKLYMGISQGQKKKTGQW